MRPLLKRWLPLAVLAATFVAMLAATWGAWPDVLVDFGHELYTPWLLARGKVLARDVVLGATGPLSPYVNALLFRLAGPSLHALVALNVALLAAFTWALFALVETATDRLAATVACLFFLAVFAVGQHFPTGNFNYVTPYSHGVTHGLLLSAIALLLACRHARTRSMRDAALASACLGLVFLTKPEIFFACGAALAVALALALRDEPSKARLLAACTLPAAGVVALAFGALALHSGAATGARAAFAPWLLAGSPLVRSPYYRMSMGLEAPGPNAVRLLRWLGAWIAVLGPAALLDLRLRSPAARRIGPWLAALAAAVLVWACFPRDAWLRLATPLPVVVLAVLVASAVAAWRAPRPVSPAVVLRAAAPALALVLLLKMVLATRLYHYGFALAMPGTLVTIAWLLHGVPARLRAAGGSGTVFRAVALVALVLVAATFVRRSASILRDKETVVGEGSDAFVADLRGPFVNAVLATLRDEPPGTLAVLPEGVMVNYLSRRETPSPYLTSLPDAVLAYGEPALLEPFRRAPPSYVVILHRDAREHGAATFGVDYAVETLHWIRQEYEPIAKFGEQPLQLKGYGAVVLKRKAR